MNYKILLLPLLYIFLFGCTGVPVDPKEESAIQENTLIVFVSDQGQRRAPFAAYYFNQKMEEMKLPFYAVYRSSNAYDDRTTIPAEVLQLHQLANRPITRNYIQQISGSDFDSALGIFHVGAIKNKLSLRDVRKVNQWNIPEMATNEWTQIGHLIKLSVDNLIATLTTS